MAWKEILRDSVKTIAELEEYIKLDDAEKQALERITAIHPLSITRQVMGLINPDDPNDPIRKMYLPGIDELDLTGTYDTSGEAANTKAVGLQHKYQPTALLLSTNVCAIYCRYCFRKRLVGLANSEVMNNFDEAIRYIGDHREITNVLISGGDSFMLETSIIKDFLKRLTEIPHIRYIRFGTKTPASLPERITEDDALIDALTEHNAKPENPRVYVFTHINHPREIGEKTWLAVSRLAEAGVMVSCQSVLLKGVNDDPGTLAKLMDGLVAVGIAPYYLFQCRPVSRVQKSFQIPIPEGVDIVETAKRRLSGVAKRFKFAMSHTRGKIEIVGRLGDEIAFKIHDAKFTEETGFMFSRPAASLGGWLPDDLGIDSSTAPREKELARSRA